MRIHTACVGFLLALSACSVRRSAEVATGDPRCAREQPESPEPTVAHGDVLTPSLQARGVGQVVVHIAREDGIAWEVDSVSWGARPRVTAFVQRMGPAGADSSWTPPLTGTKPPWYVVEALPAGAYRFGIDAFPNQAMSLVPLLVRAGYTDTVRFRVRPSYVCF
jgi:hypothetical protein